jgi:adenylate cyclase
MKDKYKVLLLLFLLISILLSTAYLFIPAHFQSLDSRVRDFYFKFRGPQMPSDEILIVDIDEKSIKELGQWPWERDKVATILQNLTDAGAGIIGLDIIFSEADKTSPQKIAKEWNLNASSLPDYDEILAKTILQTPTILGYVFDFNVHNENEAPQIPAIFIEKSKQSREYLPEAKGVLANLEIIQNAAYSSGYMNNIPDDSGIIRSVPMFIKYDMEVYPSLAFEMYRIAMNAKKVTIAYSEAGVDDIKVAGTHVSSDRFARLYLNFRGPFKTYRYISAVDVFNKSVDKSLIQGKYIFMGTSAYGLMDLRATPMDSVIAGVEIHANMFDNLLHQDMLNKPSWVELIDILSIVLMALIIVFVFSRLSLVALVPVYIMTFIGMLSFNYYMLFYEYVILNSIFPMASMLFSLVGVLGVNYMFETRQKELIKGSFSKKVSKQVMDDLLSHPDSTDLSSREVNTSIYFSDIRSFTTISETLKSPKRITEFLNFYMNAMVESVEKNNGTIDKFIGDAVMAYWNAPLKVENHADKAVLTALEQIGKRNELNVTINAKFGFDVDYGIGINTGDVVVGEIGSKGRSDYTIIGDAVNLASRLEGLCKPYKVRLIISEFTKELLTLEYVIQLLDRVRVKGKHEPVKIYEVQSLGSASTEKLEELKQYDEAHELYLNARFLESQEMFGILYEKYEKYLYLMYSQRCSELIDKNIEEFDGVFEFTSK